MRVSTTLTPNASSCAAAAWATARFTAASFVPVGPTVPGSSAPPWPGSSTTLAATIGVALLTATAAPHGDVTTKAPSARTESTAATTPVEVTTARGLPSARTAGIGRGTLVVEVLDAMVDPPGAADVVGAVV
ncbi:unannotated protein [freshwater metagenome]|uniref:Unannotated protein n=1 Tax=freshwater metagenome TaxID=449393 RepID=A0A6J7MT24_9ZZZZ